MKVVSLNTCSGFFYPALSEFIREHASTTDIFLFQEVYNATGDVPNIEGHHTKLFSELQKLLPDFVGVFYNAEIERIWEENGVQIDVPFGNATFVRSGISLLSSNVLHLSSVQTHFSRGSALVTQLKVREHQITVCNVHGCAAPIDKRDCEERILASQEIITYVEQFEGHTLIAGDFNLFPDTRSIEVFTEMGYRNLIIDHHIATTRGTLVKQMHPEYGIPPSEFQEFADYMFVMPSIITRTFEVPDLPISDHLPMILEFELDK